MKPINAEEIADVFIMLVQLFAIFNPHELVNITKIVWDKLDRLKDNLDKEAAKQEASYSWTSRTEIATERFGWCSEKKCMAYDSGRCKRLEREENQ